MTNEYINELFSLENKVVAVIGGTGELCGAMAECMAAAGAEVVLIGRSAEKGAKRIAAIEMAGGKGWFFSADVTKRSSLVGLLDEIVARSGKIDTLINGAGVNGATPFLDIQEDE